MRREVRPAHAGDEQHRERDDAVDERRAEVGLDEDERRREHPEVRIRSVMRRSEPFLARSRTNAASVITSRTLPSSEGWKVKNGSSIQRRDPRVASPSMSTRMISPIIAV